MSITAILVAAVVYFAIGPAWYGPLGNTWMKEAGLKPNDIDRKNPRPYLIAGFTSLLSAIGLAYVMSLLQPEHAGGGIGIALSFWALFSSATLAKHYAFGRKSSRLFWIDSGYDAVSYAAMGAILYLMS